MLKALTSIGMVTTVLLPSEVMKWLIGVSDREASQVKVGLNGISWMSLD